jgi:hypothetical protein
VSLSEYNPCGQWNKIKMRLPNNLVRFNLSTFWNELHKTFEAIDTVPSFMQTIVKLSLASSIFAIYLNCVLDSASWYHQFYIFPLSYLALSAFRHAA